MIALATVNPPTPESKIPIGALFFAISEVAICVSLNGDSSYPYAHALPSINVRFAHFWDENFLKIRVK
jgi:hypothetical protein